MQLLDTWKRSLDFLERKNLTLFGLVTLKAIQTTYSQIFRYLLVPIFFVLALDVMALHYNILFMHSQLWQLLIWTLRIFFLIFVYLSVRSSTLLKNWDYYRSYWKHGIYLLPFLSLVFLLLSWIGYWWWILLTPYVTFKILFFLDSLPEFKNYYDAGLRALKMIFYNLPIYLIISVLLMIIWWLYMVIVQAVAHYIPVPIADVSLLLIPAEASLLSNLYIKWFHDQFDLYFVQPK